MISGVTREREKWRDCVAETTALFGFAVGAMYVRETFDGDSKASVSNRDNLGLGFCWPIFYVNPELGQLRHSK